MREFQLSMRGGGMQLHVKCAHSLKPTLSLPSHSHLLSLIVSDNASVRKECESCHSDIPHPAVFARCVPCNLNYHISCGRVPYCFPELVMDVHQHPLSPAWTDIYWSCDVCSMKKRDWPAMKLYACLDCHKFTAHLSCISHSSFPCPFLNLVTNVDLPDLITKDGPMHGNMVCQRCNKCILNDEFPVYGCMYCRFFLHQTCIIRATVEGTLILSHPGYDLQRDNPFVLVFVHGASGIRCACCTKICIGFMFRKKDDVSFVLDLECMWVVSSLECVGHDHPVTLYHIRDDPKISSLRCIPCRKDFGIRESMCRLPHTILHECHFHPLTLVLGMDEDFDRFDILAAEQLYCDVCENKRECFGCFYCCVECEFEADLACVKSEVIALCANKPGDVKFVTLQEIRREQEANKKKAKVRDVFRLDKELSNIHVDKEIDAIFKTASKTKWKNSVSENPSYNDEFLSKTLYSDKPFKRFIEEIDSVSTLRKAYSDLKSFRFENVVYVREYLVPFDYDEGIETLFDRYGDIGKKCTCSPEMKRYLFVGLCKTLKSMCNTKVAHVTKSLLVEWWAWIVIGKAAGFEIHFVLEILVRVVYAYFGLQADKYANGKITGVRKKIREEREKVRELRRKLVETEKILEDAITQEKELRVAAFSDNKSPLMTKCVMEAEDLVCYSIVELLNLSEKDYESA